MSKVTVVGAGNVGATCANVLAFNEVADEVVMLDVKEGVSEGKAMDMMQTCLLYTSFRFRHSPFRRMRVPYRSPYRGIQASEHLRK